MHSTCVTTMACLTAKDNPLPSSITWPLPSVVVPGLCHKFQCRLTAKIPMGREWLHAEGGRIAQLVHVGRVHQQMKPSQGSHVTLGPCMLGARDGALTHNGSPTDAHSNEVTW